MADLTRQQIINDTKVVVVKVGTNVLANEAGTLDTQQVRHLADQLAALKRGGRQVVLVSSGAVGAGVGRLGLPRRPTEVSELQAAAAIGQSALIEAYESALRPHGFHAAQVLLTADAFDDRRRYLNARNTLQQLLRWDAVPIINENDTVAIEELRFGDNDKLAALVMHLIRADLLVILSVVDGLYDGMPAPGKRPIEIVEAVDATVLGLASQSTSGLGTGGMKSKLDAARVATSGGEPVWIAGGRIPNVLTRLFEGENLGTLFLPAKSKASSLKRWIGFTARPCGTVQVDDGARTALIERHRSLLAVGITAVTGTFEEGDVVSICDDHGKEFARGLCNYSSADTQTIKGWSKDQLVAHFGPICHQEVIHRDNLVVTG